LSNVDFPLLGYELDSMPRTIAARTRRIYDRLAVVYPLSTHLFHSKAHRRALEDSGIRDGMRVLEVATGSGEMFRRLVRVNRNGMTLGLDLSPVMAAKTLRRVRRDFPGSRAQCHAVDARYMPFPDGAFDALVCCYLLELLSLEDVEQTLAEFHRILRRQATLTLVLIGQDGAAFDRIYRMLGRLAPAMWGRQLDGRLREIILARDFRIVSERHVRQSGYPSRVLVARK
jgi:ubiquinone/menaquinone biosynthesis C-methylase UbiE